MDKLDERVDTKVSRRTMIKRTLGKVAEIGATVLVVNEIARSLPGSFGALEGLAFASPVAAQPEVQRPREIGEGEAIISVAYADETNFNDPEVKARIDEDIAFIKNVLSGMPIVGYPQIDISAQDRYKYNFPAVTNLGQLGAYDKERNYAFLNMEETDPVIRRWLLNHEIGGHYLSTLTNAKNLQGYIDEESAERAKQAEIDLLNQIRRYEQGYEEREANRPDLVIDQKFRDGIPVTFEEIVEAANVYPSHVFHHPEEYREFKFAGAIDSEKVRKRAEEELAAEFTGYLLTAQQLGLFDRNYEHPVHAIFKQVKQKAA